MNKEIKKVNALIESKEKERAEKLEKIESELKAIGAKLTEINARLESAADAEEYKTLIAEKRDYEATMQFYEKKAREAKKHIAPEDAKEIKKAVLSALDAIQTEHKKEIEKTIDAFFRAMEDYGNEEQEIKKLAKRALELTGEPIATTKALYPPLDAEHLDYRQIVEGYNHIATANYMRKKGGIK